MFYKFANNFLPEVEEHSFQQIEANDDVMSKFNKHAQALVAGLKSGKAIAPKAKNFVYFTAVMMHAAEACLVNPDGTRKKDASGKDIQYRWDKNGDSLKWYCSDPSIKVVRNQNLDIFPREALLFVGADGIPAYKKWAGKPLCVDHKSDQAESVRGIVVDTYYDNQYERVVALCALDKVSHPELARQITTGVSNSVSMGTGVGRAICFDCGRVARTERDFCSCMKNRTCYGEINCELNPIELSIVVNGADPHAKIKHIIAKEIPAMEQAAHRLAQYAEMKDPPKYTNIVGQLDKLGLELAKLRSTVISLASGGESPMSQATKKAEAQPEMDQINQKLDHLSDMLNKIASKDIHMVEKKSYWQGGGGVNEPTPGKVKYPNETDPNKIRDNEDKQMQGAPPFPGVGNVDSMYPGDEEKKRKLQRLAAAAERRKAAVNAIKNKMETNAYWQGGGGVNEPTPGKVKYPNETDPNKIRDNEDKQMQGAPPFPGVGNVDSLYPGDEEKKKKVQRASEKLSGKFQKAASEEESRWDFFDGEKKLVASVSVDQLVKSDVSLNFGKIATKEFGKTLLAKVKRGEKLSTAQAMPEMPPMAAPAPGDVSEGVPAEMDAGGNGDPKEQAAETVDRLEGAVADVRKVVDAIVSDVKNDESGMQAANQEGLPPELAAHVAFRTKLAKAIFLQSKALLKSYPGVKEQLVAVASMDVKKFEKKAQVQEYREVAEEVLAESKEALAEAYSVIDAFKNFAKGSKLLQNKIARFKKAEDLSDYDPLNGDITPSPGVAPVAPAAKQVKAPEFQVPSFVPKKAPNANPALDPSKRTWDPDPTIDAQMKARFESEQRMNALNPSTISDSAKQPAGTAPKVEHVGTDPYKVDLRADDGDAKDKDMDDEDKEKEDENDLVELGADGKSLKGPPEEVGKAMKAKEAQERALRRAKIAEKAMKGDTFLSDAHKGGVTPKDIKASGDLAKVETLEEVQKKMQDVALAQPKVKKMAAWLQDSILKGKVSATEPAPAGMITIAELVTSGLDPAAVKYWKQYYGEAEGGKEFATELTSDHIKAKAAETKQAEHVKMARAYDLAYEMFHAGHLADKSQIAKQASELMDYSDTAFERLQQFVRNASPKKQAGLPQVGLYGMEDQLAAPEQSGALVDRFSLALAESSKKWRGR